MSDADWWPATGATGTAAARDGAVMASAEAQMDDLIKRLIARERLAAIRSCEWILCSRLEDGSGADVALRQINEFGNSQRAKDQAA